jgi:hypothetical protein
VDMNPISLGIERTSKSVMFARPTTNTNDNHSNHVQV